MSTELIIDDELDSSNFVEEKIELVECSPSTKLERRRRIEALAEEKRLREELQDFG